MEFKNEQVVPIELGEFKGTITVPLFLESEQLAVHLEKVDDYPEISGREKKSAKSEKFRKRADYRWETVKHIILDIDFPLYDIEQIRNGSVYPALAVQIFGIIRPLITEATAVPKSLTGLTDGQSSE